MVLLIGIAVYVHGPGRGLRGDYSMAGSGYAREELNNLKRYLDEKISSF